ncbi:MAG: hypothetical protein J5J00_16625 [Deltaproteobacteria bacterium]|nr:hypothetical protein [Deltaproteobacteria bacterium]
MGKPALAAKATEIVKDTKILESKRESDTIRLWEGYREQAILWRSLALLQIPATLICVGIALFMTLTRTTVLNVPARPLPGTYSVDELNDAEFIEVAQNYINLISTYQPAVARRQFNKAREYVAEPMLTTFDQDMMITELKTIETTRKTQIFFVDPAEIIVEREGNEVWVTMTGDRVKWVAGKELPAIVTRYVLTMTTIPRNDINPYGIVVTNVQSEVVEHK